MKLNFVDEHSKQLVLFDMDGVVAEYVAGEESEGRTPLTSFTTEDVEPNDAITEARK